MKAIQCDETYARVWDEFLQNAPSASFYHQFAWKEINRQSFGHRSYYLAALEDDRIVGVLPIVFVKSRLFGNILCSMPFVNYCGLCTLNEDAEKVLLDTAESIVNENSIDYLEIRSTRRSAQVCATSEHKVSMTIDLQPDPDVLWNAFDKKHRKDIRHAYKQEINVKCGGMEYIDVFYDIMSESWKNLGTPLYDKSYFRNISSTFPEAIGIFIAYHKDIPISASLCGFYKKCVEGMWLGNRYAYRDLHAGYVLYWEMIKYFCENGFKTFNLGRSSVQSGGEFFKKKWNAYPTQLYWQYILGKRKDIPHLNVDNPKYKIAIKAWKVIPDSVTSVIGPKLAKSIP